MEKSNPRPNPHLSWTRGSYDDHEPTPAPPNRGHHTTSVLRVAQLILAALDPFPDAYHAVLTTLRSLSTDWTLEPNPNPT